MITDPVWKENVNRVGEGAGYKTNPPSLSEWDCLTLYHHANLTCFHMVSCFFCYIKKKWFKGL